MIKNLKLFLANYKFVWRVTQTISVYNFLYVEELEQHLKSQGVDIRIHLNHVHSPDYLMANVLSKEVRQQKINSIYGVISERLWQDLYGHYYNPEANGLWEDFKHFTSSVDSIRNESLNTHFNKLITL